MVFRSTGIPDLLWLLGAGWVLGPGLGLVSADGLAPAAPYFAALALAVVGFESASRVRVADAVGPSRRAVGLAAAGFLASGLAVAAGTMLVASAGWLPGWSWRHAALAGTVLGAASATVSLPALTRAKLDVRSAGWFNLESALAETVAILLGGAVLYGMEGESGSPGIPLFTGLALGLVAGFLWLLFLKTLRAVNHAYSITLGVLLVLSALAARIGGSAAAAAIGAGLVLGNAPGISRALKLSDTLELGEDVRGYHSQLAFLIKALFFVFLGVHLAGPWPALVTGLLLGVLAAGVRWPATGMVLSASAAGEPARRLLAAAGARGPVTAVLAILAAHRGINGLEALPTIAAAALLSAALATAVGVALARTAPRAAAGSWASPAPAPSWSSSPAAVPAPPPPVAPATDPFSSGALPADFLAPTPADAEITPGSGFRW